MTTPRLSAPVLVHPSELKSSPKLTSQITSLINEAFRCSKLSNPEKWNFDRPRFPTHESYYEMLVEETIVALIFDQNAPQGDINDAVGDERERISQDEGAVNGRVVACAAAVPWKGGWAREGAGKEEGWEIKAVAVNGDATYLRKGLAVQVMASLENHLIEKTKAQLKASLPRGAAPQESEQVESLILWILAAECINGAYWRKRGYHEVRRTTEGQGTWGCKTSFDIVVFRKDVKYNISI
jgi:hypothetical protein